MTAIGVLGTGIVGRTFAARLAELGLGVMVGARTPDSPNLEPVKALGVRTGSFADVVAHADLVVNATNGLHSLAALESVGAEALAGKTLIDVSNELAPVEGGFPRPMASADDSLGQRIQAAYPATYVVKALNTMNCTVMVDPSIVPGDHVVFLSGDDAGAKDRVRDFLATLGWRAVQMVDLGGIDTAAAVEMTMAIWMRVTIARGQDAPRFNWAINSH
jgi:predicted dinucleotide-binding enzyme